MKFITHIAEYIAQKTASKLYEDFCNVPEKV